MLDNLQKRHLKALAHARKAVLIVGANGLTPAVLDAIDEALKHHELIKVKVNAEDREARAALIEHICTALDSELVQRVGHIATLFRRNPEAPRLQLP
jgi:RNA-binding protein